MALGRRIQGITVLCALLSGSASAWAAPNDPSTAEMVPEILPSDEERAQQSEQARRLNRARKELENRRAEAAERAEKQQALAREKMQLQESVSGYVRRESYLGHERYWTRRQFDGITRDPADPSSMARRGALARELSDIGSQLDSAGADRESTSRRLDTLRWR